MNFTRLFLSLGHSISKLFENLLSWTSANSCYLSSPHCYPLLGKSGSHCRSCLAETSCYYLASPFYSKLDLAVDVRVQSIVLLVLSNGPGTKSAAIIV